tara:strand:- start:554 stop:754 length:201 start_codon:yes stop_codon:yes gene_type:complete
MQRFNKRICGRCGSSNLISDRSLGGKIVCVKCGSSFIKSKGIINSSNKNFYFLLLILLVIFLVVIF